MCHKQGRKAGQSRQIKGQFFLSKEKEAVLGGFEPTTLSFQGMTTKPSINVVIKAMGIVVVTDSLGT